MISAQNRRQLSNGSKIILLFYLIIALSSCGIFSSGKKYKHKRRTTHRAHKKTNKKAQTKVDTVKWPSDKHTDIEENENLHGTVKKNSYVIDLLIPFDASKNFTSLEEIEKSLTGKFLHYYSGVLLALKDLEKENANFIVNVYDAPIKNDRIDIIKSKMNMSPPDVIIGPYDKNQLAEIVRYGKRKEITVISPWKAIPKITFHNPHYIQLKPSLKMHYKALVKHVDEKFDPSQVYLLGKNSPKDKKRLKYLMKLHDELKIKTGEYHTFLIDRDSLLNSDAVFRDIFKPGDYGVKVFIIPNWSYKDEDFLYSVLRRLNVEKGNAKVYVYGMPILTKSSKIGYNLFKRLNIRVAMNKNIDNSKYEVKKFISRYYQQFDVFPLDEAFLGYDMMMFTGRNLMKYGTKFQFFIEGQEQNYLSSSVKLERNIRPEDKVPEGEEPPINYFENVKVYILGFKFNKFEKL